MSGEICKKCGLFVPLVNNGPDDVEIGEHECETELEKALNKLHEHNMRVMEACADIQASVRKIRALIS